MSEPKIYSASKDLPCVICKCIIKQNENIILVHNWGRVDSVHEKCYPDSKWDHSRKKKL